MNIEKLAAVRSYLEKEFPGSQIDEKYDFDRGAQTFRIRNERDFLILKVGEEFIEDHEPSEIQNHLKSWQVANLLRENSALGIFVGNNPPFAFSRLA